MKWNEWIERTLQKEVLQQIFKTKKNKQNEDMKRSMMSVSTSKSKKKKKRATGAEKKEKLKDELNKYLATARNQSKVNKEAMDKFQNSDNPSDMP